MKSYEELLIRYIQNQRKLRTAGGGDTADEARKYASIENRLLEWIMDEEL